MPSKRWNDRQKAETMADRSPAKRPAPPQQNQKPINAASNHSL